MQWDKETPPRWVLEMAISRAEQSIIWGMNYFQLLPTRHYLVWDKGEGFKDRTFAECELAWCSWDANAKVFKRDPLACGDYRGKQHPTQKPEALMQWCIEIAANPQTIVDPYMGAGTTLRAAKDLGIKSVGIDILEQNCEIAAKRLSQQVLQFTHSQTNSTDNQPIEQSLL